MKLFEMSAIVDERGRITLPTEPFVGAGLKFGDEVRVTLLVSQETKSLYPQLVVTPHGVEVALPIAGWQEDDEENDLTLPEKMKGFSDIEGLASVAGAAASVA